MLKERALQICGAVKYLHDNHISHGDLSVPFWFFPESQLKNVIVDSDGRYMLCDFGFAMRIGGVSIAV